MSREILKQLNLDQIADLVNDMRDWIKDCQWNDVDDEDVDAMTDEELLRGIEQHYDGGLPMFLRNSNYIAD